MAAHQIRFRQTFGTLRRGCRRWPSRARFWSRRGCSARSPACLSRKSEARTRSRASRSRPGCSGSFGRAACARRALSTTRSMIFQRLLEHEREEFCSAASPALQSLPPYVLRRIPPPDLPGHNCRKLSLSRLNQSCRAGRPASLYLSELSQDKFSRAYEVRIQ
jgi:hypothetical protein